ncbi:MAG: Ig-like domain-containing protein [Gemmatimonadales bacterium]|nr:Ig-like domain-containing protein [Gemmatimonadales bacterium]
MTSLRLLTRFLVPLSVLATAACQSDDLLLPSDGGEAQVQVNRGDEQVGLPGAQLANPLIVRLVDRAGVGIPNRAVLWVVNAGGGSVNPATGMTDAEGFASAEWVLGPSAGPNTVEARVPDIGVVTFTAIGSPNGGGGGDGGGEPSDSRSTVTAEPATIEAGPAISTVLVMVLDATGAPVEGATVTLRATGEGNTLTQPTGATGADGIAVGTLQSSVPGQKVVSAMVNGSLGLTQTATVTVTAPPASRVELIEGDNQTAPVGAPVPVRPAVRVTNDRGAPVAGIQVTFVVTGGGGSVEGATQTTNADGIARAGGWTLGAAPGNNRLEARAGSLVGSPVVFSAEGTAAPPAEVDRLVYLVGPRDVERDQSFSVEVALVDAAGNVVPMSGVFIYLGLFPEGSDSPTNDHLGGERFENTDNGVAVFNLSVEKKGRYRLRALTDDLPELGPNGPEPFLFSNVFEVD